MLTRVASVKILVLVFLACAYFTIVNKALLQVQNVVFGCRDNSRDQSPLIGGLRLCETSVHGSFNCSLKKFIFFVSCREYFQE